MSVDALKTIPEIITAASGTVLGIVALLILVLAFFGYFFFKNEQAVRYRLAVFVLMFVGTAGFSFAALLAQRADAQRVQAQLLPQLKLNLAFSGVEAANPYRAKVSVFVQPNNHVEGEYDSPQYLRADIASVPGPGGVTLEFRQLAVGDRVYVEVEDQGKKWRSYPMTMLEANLQMNPEEP
jgi:hypothetical protein